MSDRESMSRTRRGSASPGKLLRNGQEKAMYAIIRRMEDRLDRRPNDFRAKTPKVLGEHRTWIVDKTETFTGTADVSAEYWFDFCLVEADALELDAQEFAKILPRMLKSNAKTWGDAIPTKKLLDMGLKKLRQKFITRFDAGVNFTEAAEQEWYKGQTPEETVNQYADRLQRLHTQLRYADDRLPKQFVLNIRLAFKNDVEKYLRRHPDAEIDKLVEIACGVERVYKAQLGQLGEDYKKYRSDKKPSVSDPEGREKLRVAKMQGSNRIPLISESKDSPVMEDMLQVLFDKVIERLTPKKNPPWNRGPSGNGNQAKKSGYRSDRAFETGKEPSYRGKRGQANQSGYQGQAKQSGYRSDRSERESHLSDQKDMEDRKKCLHCGFRVVRTHSAANCPATGATCNECGKKGHFQRVCPERRKSRDVRQIAESGQDSNSECASDAHPGHSRQDSQE